MPMPFYSGAAGPGHVWFWQQCIDRPDHWYHFARFAKAIEELDPAGERFKPVQIPNARLHIYALQGERTFLAWCRDIDNTWQTELVDGRRPVLIQGQTVDLARQVGMGLSATRVRFYDPWMDRWADGHVADGRILLPDFTRSIVIRLEHVAPLPQP
ncbi:MAG: hypothetical protein KA354_05705 [Phycisphaerae bacterium]|nr:hypothetical protein [Phycisphaerae bacterium]